MLPQALTPEQIQGALGMTQVNPLLTAAQGFGVEVLITFVLVFVVFGVCDEKRTDVLGSGPLAIGLAVTTCHVGAVSGVRRTAVAGGGAVQGQGTMWTSGVSVVIMGSQMLSLVECANE